MVHVRLGSSSMQRPTPTFFVFCVFAYVITSAQGTKRQVLLSPSVSENNISDDRTYAITMHSEQGFQSKDGPDRSDRNRPTNSVRSRHGKQHRNETLNLVERNSTVSTENVPIIMESVEAVADGDRRHSMDQQQSSCGRHKVCSEREEMRSMRIEKIKQNILSKLRLSSPPNITEQPLSTDSAPIMELMRRYGMDQDRGTSDAEDQETEDEEVNSERVILTSRRPPFSNSLSGAGGCYFTFSEQQRSFAVHSAFLWYYVRPVNTTETYALVELQRYVASANGPPRPVWVRSLRVSLNGSSKGFWRKIRVTGLVNGWLERPSYNLGIRIISRGLSDLVMTESRVGEKNNKPFMDVELVARTRRRRKRDAAEGLRCDANSTETRCCRFDLDINFNAAGWNWIIFPRTYNARYCSGECAYLQLSNTREQLIRHMGNRPDLPSSRHVENCCVPKRMIGISMLYYDNDGNIIFSKVPDMEIVKCDCL
ncbi:growth/differentiation factor 8 [Ciona intestinalis]